MPKRTSAAEKRAATTDITPVRVVIVNLDGHLAGTTERARPSLQRELPGLQLSLHAATEWAESPIRWTGVLRTSLAATSS
jgi:magnesium chelatase subunit H